MTNREDDVSSTGELLERRREDLLRMATEQARLTEVFARFEESMARMPVPVMINTGQVRYSTDATS